jgi:uncharacterized membrane protein YidH (DUF202 family)
MSAFVTALVLATVWLTNLSLERAILLAPVLVIGVAAVAGLVVFWGRVGWDSFRKSRRPRLVAALVLAFVLLVVALTLLGVDLPRE